MLPLTGLSDAVSEDPASPGAYKVRDLLSKAYVVLREHKMGQTAINKRK